MELTEKDIALLQAFTKSCRRSIIEMTTNAQSGHPGGSLSSIDFLSVLYTQIISKTGEKIVISNGHISPAIYSILAELQYISKDDVIENFRKINSEYEGHVARIVPGVWYGTGPLGVGLSAAGGFALSEKLSRTNQKVFATIGDGEAEEGQVYELMNLAAKEKLNNLIVFLDHNHVQLTDALEKVMPLNIPEIFRAGGWRVIETDGHDYQKIWSAIGEAYKEDEKPVLITARTVMGKGVSFMENEGYAHKATWHGNAPKPEQAKVALKELELSNDEEKTIEEFVENIHWHPEKPSITSSLKQNSINTGKPFIYGPDEEVDCRTAYGKTLLDLAKLNPEIIALSADLKTSVMTKFLAEEMPDRHIETGIAEQCMVSVAGGLSLTNYIPFASTFGAFMTSRAKDQARVNDINKTNVKMVATHCGLSVGEDGPTHQSLDDMGSMLGLFNTMVIEPADPNQTDKIIRYIASHYGNFYVRMGRHKFPIITKEDGSVFYDENYKYEYGKVDVIREGSDITIAATGATVIEALKAQESLKGKISVEVLAVSSIKYCDDTLWMSLNKTKKLITVEDHNTFSGLGSQIAREIVTQKISLDKFEMLGVDNYQYSGKASELYKQVGIDSEGIAKVITKLVK